MILASSSLVPRVRESLRRFFLTPGSARPLAVLRIGVTLVALIQAGMLARHLDEVFGDRGLVQWLLGDLAVTPGMPRLSALARALHPLGIGSSLTVRLVFYGYVTSLLALFLGARTRVAAVGAWLAHLTLVDSSFLSSYGIEQFLNVSLFYCVCMPVGATFSVDGRRAPCADPRAPTHTLSLRVLQLHMCLVYLTSGVAKMRGHAWWDGEALWQSLMQPQFARFDLSWLAQVPQVTKVLGWGTLLVECGYPVFVWPRATRATWVAATIGLHLGIAIFLNLWLFAAMMIVLTAAAFGEGILFEREPRVTVVRSLAGLVRVGAPRGPS